MIPSEPGFVSSASLRYVTSTSVARREGAKTIVCSPFDEERERHVPGRVEGRLADAELAVHDRRVVDREVPLPAGGAAPVHQRHLALGEGLGQLPRVADRGRGADELRPRAVELAEPPQPPEDVRDVRAVDPAQAVQLVHHHVAQVLEELHPLRVVRQDALVEHVGVRDHDVRPRPDRLARVLRRVPVVGERPDVGPDRLDHPVQLGQLVLGQRLRREEVEGPRVRVLQDAVEDGQVVAEGLARRRSGSRPRRPSPPGPARRPRAGGCRAPGSRARRSVSRSFGCSPSGKSATWAGWAGKCRSAVRTGSVPRVFWISRPFRTERRAPSLSERVRARGLAHGARMMAEGVDTGGPESGKGVFFGGEALE